MSSNMIIKIKEHGVTSFLFSTSQNQFNTQPSVAFTINKALKSYHIIHAVIRSKTASPRQLST